MLDVIVSAAAVVMISSLRLEILAPDISFAVQVRMFRCSGVNESTQCAVP